jgi:hypothetical protein
VAMFVYFYYVRELHGLGSGSKGSKCARALDCNKDDVF